MWGSFLQRVILSLSFLGVMTHRWLHLHGSGLANLVLGRVQIQPLVLQDLSLPQDVPHVTVQELLERSNESVVTTSDKVAFNLAQGLLCLSHSNQGRPLGDDNFHFSLFMQSWSTYHTASPGQTRCQPRPCRCPCTPGCSTGYLSNQSCPLVCCQT